MTQSRIGNHNLKIKVLVVDDKATIRKIISNYLKEKGLKNTAPTDDDIMPQAIFWLKK